MVILPKKAKKVPTVKHIKITSTPGGKIVTTGDGYLNSRRVGLMTADRKDRLYIFPNPKGFTVQHSKTSWSIPIHIKGQQDAYEALKRYTDQGTLTAKVEHFKHKDGRLVPVVCVHAPEQPVTIPRLNDQQIMDLLQLLQDRGQ